MNGGEILDPLLMSLSTYVLPAVVWTAVGLAISRSGSWTRYAVFSIASFVLFLLVFQGAITPGQHLQEGQDWFLSGITALIYAVYGIIVVGLLALFTLVRADALDRKAIGRADALPDQGH